MITDFRPRSFFFDRIALDALAEHHAAAYQSAEPFPHTVINDFLPEWVIDRCIAEFPGPDDIDWALYTDRGNTLKLATEDEEKFPPFIRQLIAQLNAGPFILFLERLTGIEGLVPDPHLVGGGLHRIERGGYLKVHADFNVHAHLQLDRRINLLLYLNRVWQDEWAGHLELWDKEACRERIAPVANRCVIFNTTDNALHGHPQPLNCPPGSARKSIALYYYTKGRPAEEQSAAHSTLYQSKSDAHGTPAPARQALQSDFKRTLSRWVPPAALDFYRRRVRGRR